MIRIWLFLGRDSFGVSSLCHAADIGLDAPVLRIFPSARFVTRQVGRTVVLAVSPSESFPCAGEDDPADEDEYVEGEEFYYDDDGTFGVGYRI